MKQFAIIGLTNFGRRMLDELLSFDVEILIVDKSEALVERYKNMVSSAIVADVFDRETVRRVIPADIDAAIVDLGDRIEVSILVTNYLKQLGIPEIVARAQTDEHGQILDIAGATKVVFPNREAAKRIFPSLVSPTLFNYLPIGGNLAIAEIQLPKQLIGKSLIQADLRRRYSLNVIAVRQDSGSDYGFPEPEHRLADGNVLLIAGSEESIIDFSGAEAVPSTRENSIQKLFRQLFRRPFDAGS
jgi:trk system potassium uptake protein TrkA